MNCFIYNLDVNNNLHPVLDVMLREWGACTGCCTGARKQPDSELWPLNVNVLLNALQIIQKPSATDTGEKEREQIYSFMAAR